MDPLDQSIFRDNARLKNREFVDESAQELRHVGKSVVLAHEGAHLQKTLATDFPKIRRKCYYLNAVAKNTNLKIIDENIYI